MKFPYIGFGGALAITEFSIIITLGLFGTSVSSCSDWWVLISCKESLIGLFLWCLSIGCLFWAVLRDGHAPHEEALQAPRQSMQNPRFH